MKTQATTKPSPPAVLLLKGRVRERGDTAPTGTAALDRRWGSLIDAVRGTPPARLVVLADASAPAEHACPGWTCHPPRADQRGALRAVTIMH